MELAGPYYRIDLPIATSGLHDAMTFAIAFRDQVKKSGGTCRVFRGKVAVHLFCTAIEKAFIDELVKSWAAQYAKEGISFAACVAVLPSWPLEPGFTVGEIFHGSITKKLLMSLPDGAWLCIPGTSDHGVDPIQPGTDRQRLWEKMTKRGVAARRRYIFWSLADIRSMQEVWAKLSVTA